MNAARVPTLGLVFDPNHESPDVIDERSSTDPTRQQTGGAVPITVTPGAPQPIAGDDEARVPIFAGWNVWDVLQSQAPIDAPSGSLDAQLAAWVRSAASLAPDAQVASVTSAAAGPLVASRTNFPELAGPPLLGVGGSAVMRRTVAFQNPGARTTAPWPHDMNTLLDAAYLPAPAPAPSALPSPVVVPPLPLPLPTPPVLSAPAPSTAHGTGGGLMLALGAGLIVVLLMRARGRK